VTVPLYVVGIAFTVAALFCVYDLLMAEKFSVKLFRLLEGTILSIAAFYYWRAAIYVEIPAVHLRVIWIALCVIICSEIIMRQSWGSQNHDH